MIPKKRGHKDFLFHTRLTDSSIEQNGAGFKASLLMVHGFGENTDMFLESGLIYALNGLDVHMADLTGFGFSSGYRIMGNSLHDF